MTTPIRRGLARRFGELTGEGARGMRPLRDGMLEQGSSRKKRYWGQSIRSEC